MKKSGAWLARYALEQIGIKHTFGIPGVHNTELYDELTSSETINPILVSHEGGGAFMADAISRTSDDVGCLLIVPAAGVTHAASGIGEAFLDGVPMLVISGGIRSDSAYGYQLHDIEQHKILSGMTKASFLIEQHSDVIDTIYKAYDIATSGEPGPVFVEIPVNIQLDKGRIDKLSTYQATETNPEIDALSIQHAVDLLKSAEKPGIFVGWGGRHAVASIKLIAEHIGAPVATTLQGLSAFPDNHPLHAGFSFGPHAVPSASNAFAECDCLLAIGTRFAEIATGSFGVNVPENLIHIDINPKVFSRNFPAKVTLEGDAASLLPLLVASLLDASEATDYSALSKQISDDKASYREDWYKHDSQGRVNPARFFDALAEQIPEDSTVVLDDGNHTFLAAELMPINKTGGLISPTDFNCMGYAVPASIGAKFANPDSTVVSIVGDGAFMMTCMELSTAVKYGMGVVQFVFNDGALSQIAQAQEIPYNRTPCTSLANLDYKALAKAVGCEYVSIESDTDIESGVQQALALADSSKTVVVNVHIDYSKPTRFTEGVVKTNIQRLPTNTKVRMVGRAIYRKIKKPDQPL